MPGRIQSENFDKSFKHHVFTKLLSSPRDHIFYNQASIISQAEM